MNSMYHKALMTIAIASTLIFLLLVDNEGRDMPQAKTSIIKNSSFLKADSYYAGVLDRIEDREQAVILIEELSEQLVVSINDLPIGSQEQTWFNIVESNDEFNIVSINKRKTKQKAVESIKIMEKLQKENKMGYQMIR